MSKQSLTRKINKEKFNRYQRECRKIKIEEILSNTIEDNIRVTEKLLTSKPFSNHHKRIGDEHISISYLLKNKNAKRVSRSFSKKY